MQYTPTPQIQTGTINWSFKNSEDTVKVEVWDVVDKGIRVKPGETPRLPPEDGMSRGVWWVFVSLEGQGEGEVWNVVDEGTWVKSGETPRLPLEDGRSCRIEVEHVVGLCVSRGLGGGGGCGMWWIRAFESSREKRPQKTVGLVSK